jgi:sigma-E factor negative regulatory protein RseC
MNANKELICHSGIIEKIEHDRIFVKILSTSACSACHVKGACTLSEIREKMIEIGRNSSTHHQPGDHVEVVMEQSAGTRAVLLAYVVPVVILLISLFALNAIHLEEGMTALISLVLLVPYYLGLYLFRDRLKKTFQFKLK